ncbi:class E sortase [Streptomyces sp. NPDC005551]|uniref:class E sortase n=1 Tax=Streptomyces sp. NPDC005551 TaxID=3364725 RepID=UPI0036B30C16
MTALRPERDGSPYGGEAAYGGADAFEGAESFGGPLAGPLPPEQPAQEWYDPEGYARDWYGSSEGTRGAGAASYEPSPRQYPGPSPQGQYQDPSRPAYGGSYATPYETPGAAGYGEPAGAPYAQPTVVQPAVAPRSPDDETVALRLAEVPRRAGSAANAAGSEATGAPGGRAARRKAAGRRGRHGGAQAPAEASTAVSAERAAGAPRSRVEARRAARAQRPGAAVVVSRVIGEVFITTGVLMLLFVTYQLWWSNIRAHQQAGSAASHLQEDWANGKRTPGAFEPGQGFAILHIPRLDVVAPIAEGISKSKVLDRGMVGHYDKDSVKTAMPEAKTGNFGIAGHRNTHGEPFRYINRLKPGDPIVVETQDEYFVYEMASILPVTPPSNTGVLDPVPKGSGFTAPGRYITLTTCTPEFTSKYRMIVWGKMVEERPRSEGKPDALVE